jgi:cation diffusion facilitator CzcD-associated flavoprotein CzcO
VADVDVVIVGAGFAGLRALHTMRSREMSAVVLEASADLGGVWYHNGYPGARCDVESYDYSYRFSEELEQEWRWSERYAQRPEILSYIRHVADRFGLRPHIEFNTRMTSARYDEQARRWTVKSADAREWSARFLVLCVGQLSTTKRPDYPGQDAFRGEIYHSGEWPHHPVDFTGKSVGIIGTGSSGMQMTPVIAPLCKHLLVFQRTPNYSIPAANAPVSDEEDRAVKVNYRARREQAANSPSGLGFVPNKKSALDATPDEREAVYEAAWNRLGFGFALTYHDILLSKPANDTAVDFVRRKIGQLVEDPKVRAALMPADFPFGTRRPSVDSGYFQTFNRDNVELVDLRDTPILAFTEHGIRTTTAEHSLDLVIFATGFDAFTGSLLKPQIIGRGDVTLQSKWEKGPTTQFGVAVAGFPNLFIVVGPGSPSLLSNVLVSTEEQLDWMANLLDTMKKRSLTEFEATPEAERAWTEQVQARAKETLYLSTSSYYNGAEIPGKPRVFMPYSGGVRGYRRLLNQCAADGYAGFLLR